MTADSLRLRLRPPLIGFGLSMIGPLLLQEGSDELRKEHLPPIIEAVEAHATVGEISDTLRAVFGEHEE